MKDKSKIQNIIIIVLMLVIIGLMIEPKINRTRILENNNENTATVKLDSLPKTENKDSSISTNIISNKVPSEKEVQVLSNKIGKYQLEIVQGEEVSPEYIVIDTETGDIYRCYLSWDDQGRLKKFFEKIEVVSKANKN